MLSQFRFAHFRITYQSLFFFLSLMSQITLFLFTVQIFISQNKLFNQQSNITRDYSHHLFPSQSKLAAKSFLKFITRSSNFSAEGEKRPCVKISTLVFDSFYVARILIDPFLKSIKSQLKLYFVFENVSNGTNVSVVIYDFILFIASVRLLYVKSLKVFVVLST